MSLAFNLASDWTRFLCVFLSALRISCRAQEIHFIEAPENRTVQLDRNFTFNCQVSDGQKHTYKWFHNQKEMPRSGPNHRYKKNGRLLEFTLIKVANRGWYQCRVNDGFYGGAMESPAAYLTVHAPAVIVNKEVNSRPRLESAGSVVMIQCEAAGVPPPIIEWRRSGHLILKNQTNPQEVQTEHDTSPVSLSSTLRIVVSQSASYTCSAINFPLNVPSNDSVTIFITAIGLPETTARANITPLQCVPYSGTTCWSYLHGRTVLLASRTSSFLERDNWLEAQLQNLTSLGLFSQEMGGVLCQEPARRYLCHMTFPDCRSGTQELVPLCRESCQAVKSVFCYRHLARLDDVNLTQKLSPSIGLLALPDCTKLPSKWDSNQPCVDSDHHEYSPLYVRDDCYVQQGRWYNGTVNSTKSGHPCQAWADNSPQKHDRSPLVFPELLESHNFCRNPGGEERQPWCYTINPELRWEFCDIRACDYEEQAHKATNSSSLGKQEEDFSVVIIIGACTTVAVSFTFAIVGFLLQHYWQTRCRAVRPQKELNIDTEDLPLNSVYHQIKSNQLNPKLEAFECSRNNIIFVEDIGQGAFGRVFKGRIICDNIISTRLQADRKHNNSRSQQSRKTCRHKHPLSSRGDLDPRDSKASCEYKLSEYRSMLCQHCGDIRCRDSQLVAVKMLKNDASETVQSDFEREASLMVELDHVNIVRLLGVCTLGRPMCLLFEYMSKGDLNRFLRLCSPDQIMTQSLGELDSSLAGTSSITLVDQLHMARQIANGMVYLSDKGYVHRDLATRNCLVGSGLTVKISDFGLTRSVDSMDYYQGSDKDALPIRWMPLESILYNTFSTQSDVWSFGVVLWEIFTFALQPYYGMSHEEVVNYIRAGNNLAPPERAPLTMCEIMKSCWHRKPACRPSFVSLHKSLHLLHQDLNHSRMSSSLYTESNS